MTHVRHELFPVFVSEDDPVRIAEMVIATKQNVCPCWSCKAVQQQYEERFRALPIDIQRAALTFARLGIDVQVPVGTPVAEVA